MNARDTLNEAALRAPIELTTISLTSPKRSDQKPAVCEECLNTGNTH